LSYGNGPLVDLVLQAINAEFDEREGNDHGEPRELHRRWFHSIRASVQLTTISLSTL
jgi:hypothetical protein